MTTTPGRRRLHPIHRITLAAAVLALGLGLAGCTSGTVPVASTRASSAAATAAPTTPPHAGSAGPGTGSSPTAAPEHDVLVAGRRFRAQCDGSGPSVILVSDYGASMDDTRPFLQSLHLPARVCLYDRLGVGRSDPAPHVQTFASLADDLDGVISGLGLTRPVVVVGDVLGAPIALTWVSRHERDARAVLLTMPTPPGFMGPHGSLVGLLPPDDPGDPELSNLWRDLDRFDDPALNRESLDPRSWDAYLRLPPTSTPLYDLVGPASHPWPASVDGTKIDQAWQQAQSQVLRLSSSSRLVTVAKQADWTSALERTLEQALQG
jgi:pimeloyl-ACP methyl ester carboxylesterase